MTGHGDTPSSDALVELGRLSKPFGLTGEIKFFPVTDDAEWLFRLRDEPVYMARPGESPRAAPVSFTRPLSDCILAKIDDIDTPEEARRFAGTILYIHEDNRPSLPEGEFYVDQLFGMAVIDASGRKLGEVMRAVESKTDTLLEVRGNTSFLLSLSRELVDRVDQERGEIRLAVTMDHIR